MRTSRISRDTSRVLAATRAPRPLRHSRTTVKTYAIESDEGASSGSELSSVPDFSSGSDGDVQLGVKRKKGEIKSERQDKPLNSIASPAKGRRGKAVKKEDEETGSEAVAAPEKKKKPRRAPAKKVKIENGIKMEPPQNWEEMYTLTREMRNENLAPVDTMGCESLAEKHRSPRDRRFQTLIALMLSSQTKDTVTAVAMRGMQENMPGGFNLESVLALQPSELNAFISKVGFHNLKTKYILSTAAILRDKFAGDIPDTIDGLVSLPGVGPKMAYLTMSAAWGKDLGIGVDVHVHRITNLWGWNETQTPEQTRAALESWLPKDKWHDINNLLVGFGQTICLPVGRRCGDCKLADRGLCPSVIVGKPKKIKKEVATKVDAIKAEDGQLVPEETELKVEDVPFKIEDIEDIGLARN